MAPIPEPTDTIKKRINEYHEKNKELPRQHFGLSQAGHHCARWLWLSYRWAVVEQFPGRILRLFRRGHQEEYNVVADLKAAGLELMNTLDNQKELVASPLVKGHADGLVISGVPEAPKKMHLLEIKTHSKKSFDDLERNGVEKSKPMHYIQMQVYMALWKPVSRALYVAICKDDDRIYTERVRLDNKTAKNHIDRAIRISTDEHIPDPISANPSWYQCKWCAAHSFCHEKRRTVEINCRTCAHSTPGWRCERWGQEIPADAQYKGCRDHTFHPDMVQWELSGGDGFTAEYVVNGQPVKNGVDGYTSAELLVMAETGTNPGAAVDKIRDAFAGEVVKYDAGKGDSERRDLF